MPKGVRARIVGMGSYLPERVLTNYDLEKMVDTSNEWIVTRTGIETRRIAGEEELASDMGIEAANKALEAARIDPKDIDMILVATLSPDYQTPSTACLIQDRLGAINAAAMDLQAACTGYIYALSMAKAFIESKIYKNVLIIASEKLSHLIDYQDRNTCILFGDGAAASVVSAEGAGLAIDTVSLGADGEHAQLVIIPAGGAKHPPTYETLDQRAHYLKMEGKALFKHAVRRMSGSINECLEKAGLRSDQISWVVPHQANIRILESLAEYTQTPYERVFKTIHKYGNTSASSIAIALDELLKQEHLADKEHLLLVAFGGGLTWGAAILTQIK